jgi:diamine N-acetyltransferase
MFIIRKGYLLSRLIRVATILYMDMDQRNIDMIEPLWVQLNEHHRVLSPHFSSHYEKFTFGQRKGDLLGKAARGLMRITMAKDVDSGQFVGYVVSTLLMDGDAPAGEVESIFVEDPYRSSGIGDKLMKKALEWMDSKGAESKKVAVGAGNEGVFPFYAKYGFYTRMTMLEQIKK